MHTHDLLAIASAIVPDRVATTFDGATRTYAELAERSNRLANALANFLFYSGQIGPGAHPQAVVHIVRPAHGHRLDSHGYRFRMTR